MRNEHSLHWLVSIALVVAAITPTAIAIAHTQASQPSSEPPDGSQLWFWSVRTGPPMLVIVIMLIIVAILRARRVPPVVNIFEDHAASTSQWIASKYDAVLRNLREGNPTSFFMALTDMVYLPYYREDIIVELSLALAKVGTYAECHFIDAQLRCKICRFLHLAVERNHRISASTPMTDSLPFQDVFSDSTYCRSLDAQRGFLGRLVSEWSRFWSRVPGPEE